MPEMMRDTLWMRPASGQCQMSIRPEGAQPGGFAPPGLRLQILQSEDVPERDRLEPRLLLVERKREQVTILGMAEDRRQQNQLLA